MNSVRIIIALSLMNLSQLSAQDADSAILIRSVYHNPISPVADLYVADKSGSLVKLNLVVEGLGEPQVARTTNGSTPLATSTPSALQIFSKCAVSTPGGTKRNG